MESERARRAREKRNSYLFSHMDARTANYFINLWDSAGIGQVIETIPESTMNFQNRETFEQKMKRKHTSMKPVELVVKNIKYEYEELSARVQRGFKSEDDRLNCIQAIQIWYDSMKERMIRDRISKYDMKKYHLNWKQCQAFYFSQVR